MNSKLLFFCIFLVLLILPVQLHKHEKHEKHMKQEKHNKKPERKYRRFEDILKDPFFEIVDEPGEDDSDDPDWLYELQEPHGQCNPNPCLNNGVCEQKGKKFKCDCAKPFKGKKCQKGPKRCKTGTCGRGECVLTSKPPFYECKCKQPFLPPDCKSFAVCQPNPCKNGGLCVRDGMDFDCLCPEGFKGSFCHVGPNDCYKLKDEGESYRGNVSETDDGDECLYWNSHFILKKGVDPFNDFEDDDGLGPHNFCRNPDGDTKPWCFIRRGRALLWDHCDVRKCATGPKPTTTTTTTTKPTTTTTKPTAGPKPTTITTKPTAGPKPTTITTKPTAGPKPPTITTKPTTTTTKPTAGPNTTTTTTKPTAGPNPTTTPPKPKPTPAKPSAGPEKPTAPKPSGAPGLTTASLTSDKQFTTCGKPQPKKAITRIYGGLKAIPGAQPWQLSLQVRPKSSSQSYRHICGAVLIDSCWALTAGHCIDPKDQMQVVAGSLTLGTDVPIGQTIQVEKATRHENYKETSAAVYNDIALLKLKTTDGRCARESQFVKAACLPDSSFPDGTECTISGWGATKDSVYGSNHLQDAQVLLISQKSCSSSKVYGSTIDNTMFCAGYLQGGADSCQGDSGGPLTCNKEGTHFIYGIVSWGDQCGLKNKPGVYTRVSHYLDWIKSKTQAA
ncbi:hyaluronan-binding protein 2 isoform X2 [Coregonus clupeaformis]|uniref:hyaluronan-binding protein 2 isoform X2 n=1 Tax=Coregonus clupeaformis TaxID=59861 RepID=UPI001BE0E58E|nr:hyaluronan-binding protein 2 isoform X2 [Coregonus clupeaformis]